MVLVAKGVKRAYGDVVALDGVSLAIDRGEVYALVGPNGAGKTTLIRALTGIIDVEGEVRLFDAAPSAVDAERLGVLPQAFAPPGRLTPRELVTYYGGLYDHAAPTAALTAVGLDAPAVDTAYRRLSGGQQRRTCVAIALVNDPELLVLDEPTAGIDPAGRRALWELIESLADDGTTVLVTTHYMEEAERLADRVGMLADGRLVAEGPPQELIAEHGGGARLELTVAAGHADATADGEGDPWGDAIDGDARDRGGGDGDGGEDGNGGRPSDRDGDADTSDPIAALTAAGFRARRIGARRVLVEDATAHDVAAALDALEAADVAYSAVTWRQPDLETAYLHLTGADRPTDVASDATTGRRTDASFERVIAGAEADRPTGEERGHDGRKRDHGDGTADPVEADDRRHGRS